MVSVLLKKNNRRQVSAKKKIFFVSIQNRMMDNYLKIRICTEVINVI